MQGSRRDGANNVAIQGQCIAPSSFPGSMRMGDQFRSPCKDRIKCPRKILAIGPQVFSQAELLVHRRTLHTVKLPAFSIHSIFLICSPSVRNTCANFKCGRNPINGFIRKRSAPRRSAQRQQTDCQYEISETALRPQMYLNMFPLHFCRHLPFCRLLFGSMKGSSGRSPDTKSPQSSLRAVSTALSILSPSEFARTSCSTLPISGKNSPLGPCGVINL
jgi:hypothetical protein